MKNKKIMIIGAVIIVAVLGTVFFVFKKNQKNKTKTYPQDSVEYAAKELITDWFDAVISKDYDKYLRCCFPDEIKSYIMNQTGLEEKQFEEYVKYSMGPGDFSYKNLEIVKKENLPEEFFGEINIAIDNGSKISHMYEIVFKYEIMYDNEWQKVEENCRIIMINGKCYIFNEDGRNKE